MTNVIEEDRDTFSYISRQDNTEITDIAATTS